MSLTEQQVLAAHAPCSVAVTAGAGTGKTHMLAERYQYFLTPAQGFTPLEIVAVTFTEKAATEMRSRIRQTVAQATIDRSDLIAEIEAAQISTFHALAARICREHPDEADVPPDFTLLDDIDGKVWQAETILEALDRLPRDLYEGVPYSLMSTLIHNFLHDPLSAEQALSRERADWLPIVKAAQEQALNELLNHASWRQSGEMLASHSAPGDKLDVVREEALEAIAAIEQHQALPMSLDTIAKLKINVGSQRNWGSKDNLDDVKAAIKAIRELAENALKDGIVTLIPNEFDDRTEAMLPNLRKAFSAVRTHLDRAKQVRRVLDFSDLEVHALKALEHSHVRDYYARRWKVFMIDEFQDTNLIQGRLLELLTEKSILTIVGDVKQSIYGFRRADVKVFEHWCDRIVKSGGKSAILDLSFRTHHTLIQQINRVFKPILGKQHQDLASSRSAEPHSAPHLSVCTVNVADDIQPKPDVEERRRVEAQHIANSIKKMLDDRIQIHDKHSNRLRPIQPSDIAILSRAWDPLEIYGQALEGRGIPILQAGGGNLLDTREAKDAWALLRFLANPSDDLALVAVLRSPFFAMSDPMLFALSQTLPDKTSWWKQIKTSSEPVLVRCVECLNRLLGERSTEAPTRLLQIADRLTGYTAVIANLPGSTRRTADWQGFGGFIRQLELGTNDVLSVVRRLQQIVTSDVQIPRPAIEGGNAVSLMTIHAAKGLEWPIVVVPDLTRGSVNDSALVYFDPELGVALKLEDDDGAKQKSALLTLLEYRKRQAEQEETKRVLYVAMTRVRDQLILTAPSTTGTSLDLLLPGLELQPELIPFDPELAKPVDAVPPQFPTAPALMLLTKMGAGLSELPVTALTDYAYCPKRFEYKYVLGHPGYRSGVGSGAAEVGRLVHLAIERNITDRETLIQSSRDLSDEIVQEVLDLAQSFRKSEIYATYLQGAQAWEHPISLTIDSIKLNGFIDLLGADFILDFKTDRIIEPTHHRFQLWAYAAATKKSTAHIAYLRHDGVHTFDSQALSSIHQEAQSLIHSIQTARFSPTPSLASCDICPYTEICDSGIEDPTARE